jgi:hypothetical protein
VAVHLDTPDEPLERLVWEAFEDVVDSDDEPSTDRVLQRLAESATPSQLKAARERALHEGIELGCQRYLEARDQHKTTYSFLNAHADFAKLER